MGGSGENNGIWGSFEERWFKKSHLYFYYGLKAKFSARRRWSQKTGQCVKL
jgi:hypothetical protein